MRLPPSAVHVPHHHVPCLTTTAPSTNLRVPKTPPLPALAPSRAAHAPCRGHRHVALWSARRPRGKRRSGRQRRSASERWRRGWRRKPRRRGGERRRPRHPSRGRSSSKSSRRRAASQRRRPSALQRGGRADGTRATFRRPPAAPLHPSTASRGQAGRRRRYHPRCGVLSVRGELGGHSVTDLFRQRHCLSS